MNRSSTNTLSRRFTSPVTRLTWSNHLERPVNLWMVVAVLALSGWFVDSLLVGVRMHRLPGDSLAVHLWHLWYGPPLLVGGLLLARHYRPGLMQWVAALPRFDVLSGGLPPKVKALALHVTRSETQSVLLAFLQRHPTLSLTPSDLAGQVGGELDDVELALRELATLELVEKQRICDLTFYRLTQDEERQGELRALLAWQDSWLEQARQLTQSVGRGLVGVSRLERR